MDLNGALFRVNLNLLPTEHLRTLLKACGIKSLTTSPRQQLIFMVQIIRNYLLTGNDEVLSYSKENSRQIDHNFENMSLNTIISDETLSRSNICKAIKSNVTLFENILLNEHVGLDDIIETCSTYLKVPINIFKDSNVINKIQEILSIDGIES
ncbi:uncharacterized protein CMU_003430 [Cryptosporidium muris RN66]|uniref:Uncharacterized protein n=1 Tax=Cryptosporidium muris (strain RN66) TaxID=441375 RepID=B6AJX2_CRYMR|nr:uncharacterized protein CMU_003430 [Cryptosporidium muris RN66]EEA08513.1 hypothetical protein, conserved [Cryptosporidium muris RN66]|eukprot:XP_002142862.1 hypothetical protein [Cryptosporidium muris RN66]